MEEEAWAALEQVLLRPDILFHLDIVGEEENYQLENLMFFHHLSSKVWEHIEEDHTKVKMGSAICFFKAMFPFCKQ